MVYYKRAEVDDAMMGIWREVAGDYNEPDSTLMLDTKVWASCRKPAK